MILLSASGGVIHLIDAFQGTQLHTFTVSKVKKAIIGFLAFIRIIIFFVNDIWNKSCMNCGNEMKWKWRNDRRSEHNLCNCVKKPEKKIQDFNRVWTRKLAIPVRCSTNWPMKPPTLGAGQLVSQFHMWIEISFNPWVILCQTSDIRHQTSDVTDTCHQTSDISCLITDTCHQTSDNRHLIWDVW